MRAKPNPALKKQLKVEKEENKITLPKYNIVYKEEIDIEDFLSVAEEKESVLDLLVEEE